MRMLKTVSLLTVMSLCCLTMAYGQDDFLWGQYKSAFISNDGRIIDFMNKEISHSEGQGYGMLLSIAYNDKAVFDRLWQWTKANMGGRPDNLFAWHWGKRSNGQWGIVDYNNATDGDILIAYALLKGAEKWSDDNYKVEGVKIASSLRKNLSVSCQGHTFLLPSYYGFARDDGFVLNPSYLIFPAYRYFAQADDRPFWEKVYNDGSSIIGKGCFGAFCLPSDWIYMTENRTSIFIEKSPYFGYEAVRILLNMSGENGLQLPKGLDKILGVYEKLGYVPLWIDLERDSISITHSPAGFYAIYARAAERVGKNGLGRKLFKEAREKLQTEKKDYYSFTLYLMATVKEIF